MAGPAMVKGASWGGRSISRAMKAVPKAASTARQVVKNGNNLIRVGSPKSGVPFRVSIGPAPGHQTGSRLGSKIPFNIHLEKAKAGLNTKAGKCIKFWGNWRC